MSSHREIFRLAREAAVLIPSERDDDRFPEGAAMLCPLDADGVMCANKGRLVFNCRTIEDLATDYIDCLYLAAVGVTRPGYAGVLATCLPSEIQMAGIYSLDRRVLTSITLPSLLEDWAEEDREVLLPEPAPSGTTDPDEISRVRAGGERRRLADRGFVQMRSGQVLVLAAGARPEQLFDHDDPRLLEIARAAALSDHDLLRLLGYRAEA